MTRGTLMVAAGVVLGAVGHDRGPARREARVGQTAGGAGDRREAGRQGDEGDGGRGDARTRPGGRPHRHPGPAFGYVLEGEYEWAIDDQPAKVLKAGETFYEPGGCLHRVSRNPGKVKTRMLAWVLHPRDAKDLVIPEPKK